MSDKICFKMLKSEFNEKELVIFRQGEFATPICILGAVDVKELKKEIKMKG